MSIKAKLSLAALAISKSFIIILICFAINDAFAQSSDTILYKPISIKLKGLTIYQALNEISEKAGCFFIYDSKDVNSNKHVPTIQAENKPLKELLIELLNDPSLNFRVIDKHILIYHDDTKSSTNPIVKSDTLGFELIRGTVLEKGSSQPIPFATVGIQKLGLGTITNNDGYFTLRIPKTVLKSNIVVSHLGYQNESIPIDLLRGKPYNIFIEPIYIPIQEVIIRNIDAKGIVKSAMDDRYQNYGAKDVYLNSFYREGVTRNNNYLSYSEAVFKIFKSSYTEGPDYDQVRLLKSRKLEKTDRRDTLIVKLKAGIRGALDLDIVKSIPDFLDPEFMDNYVYIKTDIVAYDSTSAYVINFEQKQGINQPLFSGTLYIDVENLTLLEADFGINPKFVEKSTGLFVIKRDKGLNIIPKKVQYTVKYHNWDGRYYIHHIRGDLTFRVKEKRQIFANNYSLFFEFVGIQIDTMNVQRFSRRDIIRPNIVFSEGQYNYDPDFWNDVNIITPEDDINKSISRINAKIESINENQ